MVKVTCIIDDFFDMEENVLRQKHDTWYTNKVRADHLISLGLVKDE